MRRRTYRPRLTAALVAGLVLGGPARLAAHEIPARVAVRAFVKPEGRRLWLAVRVPLEAMRDIEFPQRGPGYLDLARTAPLLDEAARIWIAGSIAVEENGHPLPDPRIAGVRISLPSDPSFESYAEARLHLAAAPIPAETELFWRQAMLDVLLEYPIESDRSDFSVRPTLARLGLQTTTTLRFLPADPPGAERAYLFVGDPGLVRLDPHWYQAALRFVQLGFRHILDGIDHLLFLFCLVIPVRRVRPLVAVVTSFTVAHSITLIAATAGLAPSALWFPPLIETLIALSIVVLAFENIIGAKPARRWLLAFGFGLIHGFGFSLFLRDSFQFAGTHLAAALLSFNLGVELGQLLVLVVTVPVLAWLFRRVMPERTGTILLSALVAHSAWHWMAERWSVLRQYRFQRPELDASLTGEVLRALLLLLVVFGAGWLMRALARKLTPPIGPERPPVSTGN